MKYYKAEFHINCSEDLLEPSRELLADLAGEAGFESFQDSEYGIDGFVQVDAFDQNLLDQLLTEFPIDGVVITYNINNVIDEDWNKEWEAQGFDPIDIEETLMVFDASKKIPEMHRNYSIGIEARNAFGTGTHETTQMILAQLLHTDCNEKRVLDCGCGTGILGIAASQFGATDVVAYDIDEWSVENTKHNAKLNGVRNIEVFHGDSQVLTHINGVFDIVLANINRNILLNDMESFREVMNIGATLIISGFYESDITLLLEKAWELGMSEYARKENGDWRMLVLK